MKSNEIDSEMGKLVEEEETSSGSKLSSIKFYFEAIGYFVIAFTICLFALKKVISVWTNVWLQHWSDMVITFLSQVIKVFKCLRKPSSMVVKYELIDW